MFRRMLIGCLVVGSAMVAVAAEAGEDSPANLFEARQYRSAEGPYKDHPLPWRLLKPGQVEAGKKYPVVLFLHGAGERGDDNLAQLKYLPDWMAQEPYRTKYPCFLIAPQCPRERIWSSFHFRDPQAKMTPEPNAEMQGVMAMLAEVLKDPAADPTRIYLTGLSMGGYGSWELAARKPELFAAVGPICGGGDLSSVDRLVKVPLWVWHGDADQAVPVERSRQMVQAIRAAGGEPKYTELPGVGHDSWTPAYRNPDGMVPWMFSQSRKTGGR